jgi:hypothetical protein
VDVDAPALAFGSFGPHRSGLQDIVPVEADRAAVGSTCVHRPTGEDQLAIYADRSARQRDVSVQVGARGIERAGLVDLPPFENDHPVVHLDAARFNEAAVIDHPGQQTVAGSGRHDHLPTVGLDELAVLGQAIDRALIDSQLHETVAAKSQRRGTAGTKGHRPQAGADRSLVAHLIA